MAASTIATKYWYTVPLLTTMDHSINASKALYKKPTTEQAYNTTLAPENVGSLNPWKHSLAYISTHKKGLPVDPAYAYYEMLTIFLIYRPKPPMQKFLKDLGEYLCIECRTFNASYCDKVVRGLSRWIIREPDRVENLIEDVRRLGNPPYLLLYLIHGNGDTFLKGLKRGGLYTDRIANQIDEYYKYPKGSSFEDVFHEQWAYCPDALDRVNQHPVHRRESRLTTRSWNTLPILTTRDCLTNLCHSLYAEAITEREYGKIPPMGNYVVSEELHSKISWKFPLGVIEAHRIKSKAGTFYDAHALLAIFLIYRPRPIMQDFLKDLGKHLKVKGAYNHASYCHFVMEAVSANAAFIRNFVSLVSAMKAKGYHSYLFRCLICSNGNTFLEDLRKRGKLTDRITDALDKYPKGISIEKALRSSWAYCPEAFARVH